jgi:hypothetical protein
MSAHQLPEPESRLLKKRADYFFDSAVRSRGEVAEFAKALQEIGPCVVIGGFLRDLLLSGNREFTSDVDFVVDPASMGEFEKFVGGRGAVLNKFGGYGISLRRWKVDVWPLERTWAAVSGHVVVQNLDDLLKVTFFDWDAILYSVRQQKLIARGEYFEKINRRVLDVNLQPNPNPIGNAVRALRYAYRWEAAIGRTLATHVAKQIRDCSWTTMVDYERKSAPNPILGSFDGDHLFQVLRKNIALGNEHVHLPLKPQQQEFTFGDAGYSPRSAG